MSANETQTNPVFADCVRAAGDAWGSYTHRLSQAQRGLGASAADVDAAGVDAAGAGDESLSPLYVAQCIRLDKSYPMVVCARGTMRGEFAAQRSKRSDKLQVCIGDWVIIRIDAAHNMAIIVDVCPRIRAFSRWIGDRRGTMQTLAANITHVALTCALGAQPLCLDQLLRACVIAAHNNITPCIILTKADRISPASLCEQLERLFRAIPPRVCVYVCSATAFLDGGEDACIQSFLGDAAVASLMRTHPQVTWGVSAVRRALCGAGAGAAADAGDAAGNDGTANGADASNVAPSACVDSPSSSSTAPFVTMFFGMSGAGKSTLINTLLHQHIMDTSHTRARDDAGRHTTVSRRLLRVNDHAMLIDCPGLRTLRLLFEEDGVRRLFADALPQDVACKFSDCTHTHEPGCALKDVAYARVYAQLMGEIADAQTEVAADVRG